MTKEFNNVSSLVKSVRQNKLTAVKLMFSDKIALNARSLQIAKLAQFLINDKSIEMLDLRDNDLGDEAIMIIAESLRTHDGLRNLDIRGNNITDEASIIIQEILQDNKLLDININYQINIKKINR